jgi:hypothetical protein
MTTDAEKAWGECEPDNKELRRIFIEAFEAGQKAERERILKILKTQKADCVKCFRPYTAEMFDEIISEIEGDSK